MKSESILNGNIIAEQSMAIISCIEEELNKYCEIIRIIEKFIENNLKGHAVEAIKEKLMLYLNITAKLIEADERDIDDLKLLSDCVNGITINGSEIVEGKIRAKKNISYCEDMIYHYRLLANCSMYGFENEYYCDLIQIQMKYEEIWYRIYEKLCEQEDIYDRIDSETKKLFKKGNSIRCGIVALLNEKKLVSNIDENILKINRVIGIEERTLEGVELLEKYLREQKDEFGNSLYTEHQIDEIVDYMLKNYKNQLNNLAVLNVYCSTDFDHLLKMCLEYSKDYDKVLSDVEIKKLLVQCGWNDVNITQIMIDDLQETLKKYNINTQEQVCAFLAQCTYETGYGVSVIEYGSDDYFNANGYGSKYRGAGYIQLTWEYGYQAFVIYLTLKEYPELCECIEYKNPAHNSSEIIDNEYNLLIEEAKKKKYRYYIFYKYC